MRKADPLFKTTKKTGLPKPPKIPKIHKLPKIPRPPRGLVINGHKDCSRCKASLPICSFYPNPKVKSGLSSACKVCTAAYHRSRRPPKHPKRDLPDGFKECTKCRIVKEASLQFFVKQKSLSGLTSQCRSCFSEYGKLRRAKDPQKIKEGQRRSNQKHKKKLQKYRKKYNSGRRAKVNADLKRKRAEDPLFTLAANLRRAVCGCIKRKGFRKQSSLSEYLGCNSQEFKVYIESLWEPGMSWNNYGNGSISGTWTIPCH